MKVLVVTNLWPYEADPSYGCFVKAQMESLRPLGVDYDVLFINGRESRWNYLRALPQLWQRLRAHRYDLIHAHMGLSGLVARCQISVPLVVSFMGFDVTGKFKGSDHISAFGRFYQLSSFLAGTPRFCGHCQNCRAEKPVEARGGAGHPERS